MARRGYRFIAPVTQQFTGVGAVQENQLKPLGPLLPGLAAAASPRAAAAGHRVARPEIDDALAAPESPRRCAADETAQHLHMDCGGAGALLIAAGAAVWQAGRTPAQELWSGVMLGGPAKAFQPRLSPDGQLLAFLAFVDQLPQLAVMKPNGGSWTILTSDREHGYITTAAWASDGSKIYFDRSVGLPARHLLRAAAGR